MKRRKETKADWVEHQKAAMLDYNSLAYRIVEGSTFHRVSEIVNSLISIGWRPLGGVSAITSEKGEIYTVYQTMVLLDVKD